MSAMERTLPREAYTSDDTFRREREAIFFREWFCAARGEDVPTPGDYRVLDVAGESVLLLRDRERDIRAFYNVCRHRGCRLIEPPATEPRSGPGPDGRVGSTIRCPYHAWTYGLDGALRRAPFLDESDGLVPEALPLHTVGVAEWGGFVFVNLTPREAEWDGRDLDRQLGNVPARLSRYPLGQLRVGGRLVYDVAANWKVILENFNECYHCGPVHPELCRVVPAFRRDGGAGLDWQGGIPHRDGAWTFTATGTSARRPFPGLSQEERTRHKGELIYPNLMLSLSADHVTATTLWPQGPERTLVACDVLFHPTEMDRPGFDSSDAVGFWDLVNRQDWAICEGVQAGMRSRVWRFGYYAPMEEESLDIRRYVEERLR